LAKRRRALSNVGGKAESRGDPAFTFLLAQALEAASAEDELGDALTHGFHSYPARMHPAVARTLLEQLWVKGGVVLDPFCGSGTVLVEAMLAGWRSLGSDLNPLALRLARVKTQRRNPNTRERFLNHAMEVARASEQRVRSRQDVRANLPREELAWYTPHVLKELAGLLEEIRAVRSEDDRHALEMVFSAIVVKFSRQSSDTNQETTDKRIRKGLPTEFFVRKARELASRWEALDEALPPRVKRPHIVQSDARVLPRTLSGEFRCDLVLTSPPYGGTYDYVEHHARRYPWLGINPGQLRKKEIGARRRLSEGAGSAAQWDTEVSEFLAAMSELLAPEGVAILLTGDGEVGGKRVAADAQLERATASQTRVDRRGGEPRREHLVALLKA
jgi:adenine-specific DNA methylase